MGKKPLPQIKAPPQREGETVTDTLRRRLENNWIYAVSALLILLGSMGGSIVAGLSSIKHWIVPPPPSIEEQVSALARNGCLIFIADQQLVYEDEQVLVAYRDFWRNTDIRYADRIEIEGRMRAEGTSAYNLGLSDLRAAIATKYLQNKIPLDLDRVPAKNIPSGEERGIDRIGEYECGVIVHVYRDDKEKDPTPPDDGFLLQFFAHSNRRTAS